ncbi:DMT family transporter [Mucilaginibacter sp. JRF]|uniref:DMT family transporter n=1 Tax=Mucilaginibacter sp. JRF TaxID=2780088 RepID=UPI001880C9D2|nr:DMT family transporter [Mucilaginibacter sp. JRF]MBE9585835.1 DMT family transporter [Mucilaginibacter sp. JRF]
MKRSYIVLHLAVILAGFTGVFGKLISLNQVPLVWYRVFFSAIILWFVLRLFKVSTAITAKQKFDIAKVGMLITIHWVFFYASIKYSNISVGVVCYCLTSFFTAIFAPFVNRQRFNVTELGLSMLTLFGIALIFHFDSSYQLGIGLGVISSAFAALYTIYNERLVKQYDSRLINFYQMAGGTVGLGVLMPVYLWFYPVNVIPNFTDVGYLLLLASICTVGLYIMFAETLKLIPAFTVNLSFNLEPVYSIVLAFLFFKEGREVNFSFYLGLLFVMMSVVLQTMISVRKSRVVV